MINNLFVEKIKSIGIFIQQWGHENLLGFPGMMQIGVVVITGLLALLVRKKFRLYFENIINHSDHPYQEELAPQRFSGVMHYGVWLLLLWFCLSLFDEIGISTGLLNLAQYCVTATLVIYYAFSYLKSIVWSYIVSAFVVLGVALRIVGVFDQAVKLLDAMSVSMGHIHISILDFCRGLVVWIILWSIASLLNRFLSFLLINYSKLRSSDRLLAERIIRFASFAVVFLVTMGALGIHLTTIAVTGGAFGLALGVGLKKIGSNLVSGITLLIRKPVQVGDLLILDGGPGKGIYTGRIDSMGLLYVHLITRDGTEEFIPNEYFLTEKIRNISYLDNFYRLHIPFGISYKSNLKVAAALAVEAAKNVDRVVAIPKPKCLVMNFGESTVNLELRTWIKDPENGISGAKSLVLNEVWDIFKANNIELSFPQRDLHFKDALPVIISKEQS